MCHRGTITISLKNTIIYVYVYVKEFTLTFTLNYPYGLAARLLGKEKVRTPHLEF
jgi:hypothetical protein